jgi:spoIIIJ-associated protein
MTEMQDGQPELEAGQEAGASAVVDAATLNPDQSKALALVEGICAASGLGARAVVRSVQRQYIHIEMIGEEVRATFGRMGQSLDALQFLCNMILSRGEGSEVRLMLDAEGYRERRAASLIQRAKELANEVKARNQEAELEPLPAHERRIIHAALAEDPEISTYSEGDEPARRVVISPRPK